MIKHFVNNFKPSWIKGLKLRVWHYFKLTMTLLTSNIIWNIDNIAIVKIDNVIKEQYLGIQSSLNLSFCLWFSIHYFHIYKFKLLISAHFFHSKTCFKFVDCLYIKMKNGTLVSFLCMLAMKLFDSEKCQQFRRTYDYFSVYNAPFLYTSTLVSYVLDIMWSRNFIPRLPFKIMATGDIIIWVT